MRKRILVMLAFWGLAGVAFAQQAAAPPLPAMDAAAISIMKPLVVEMNAAIAQLQVAQKDWRIGQQVVLNTAKQDPQYVGVSPDGLRLMYIRQLPQLPQPPR